MTGKKAAMTPTQISAAGWVVEQYVPVDASAFTKARPWVLRRRGTQEWMTRYETRDDAIAELVAIILAVAEGGAP